MSSILDALKKSERQHSLGRDLVFRSATHDAPPRLTRFRVAVLGMLLFLAVVIGVVLFSLRQPESAEIVRPPSKPANSEISAARIGSARDQKGEIQSATRPEAASSPAPELGGTPWLSSLSEVFRSSLPPLNVNIHVYSPDESQRILYINNRQVQQGERIQAGVLVEEIVQDGVVLRFRGQRFKLPRPS